MQNWKFIVIGLTDIGFLAHSETEINATDYKPGQLPLCFYALKSNMLCKTGSSILSLCLMQNIAQSTMPQHSFKGSYSAYYWLLCLTHIIGLVSSLLPFLFKWQLWQHEWLLVMQRTLLVTYHRLWKWNQNIHWAAEERNYLPDCCINWSSISIQSHFQM